MDLLSEADSVLTLPCRQPKTLGPQLKHGDLWRPAGGGWLLWPLPEADLCPLLSAVTVIRRRVHRHRLPGLHPRSLVPGHCHRGEEAGVWLGPGRESQADGPSGQQLWGPEAQQLWNVRGGLELYRTHLWPAGTGPEETDPNSMQGQLQKSVISSLWWIQMKSYL